METSYIEVLPIKTDVIISPDEEVIGTIIGILIGPGNNIQYNISYWTGYDHQSEYFPAFQITPVDDECKKQKIGFIKK
jgi:hypothetical protein